MGRADDTTPRRLRLERETLRDLAPDREDVRAVRGGDDDSRTGPYRFCTPDYAEAMAFLAKTFMSYGCVGRIRHIRTDDGYETHVELQPNQATLEAHEIAKQQAIASNPELGGKLDEISQRFG